MTEQKNTEALPAKIESRLMELLQMGEFNLSEVEECRRTYWARRGEWHTILVNCHNRALERLGAA
ncbi:hypothetical protein EUC41_31105 [Achromobacter denitrificans]|uniref:Uncharacterized protein n=1 Tax=Achromobacter denitrificans TaxID=32002 RepID=A0ABZ3G569_ACHDE|nr:hypothetical protein [Achromobacter denitrificans]MDX3878144.1 hypothetical protein [Achromobacter sp.]WFC70363.1 hypothetical protein EUC41_31105 [Achromobacter denitrificans]CAB3861153.1 hypothetical protein LMG1860_03337 [Achromobacter denitrificans]